MIKKAVTLLENGSVMGKCFQPYEAHLPYILQFMIDYNLHGMSFINLSEIRFRVDLSNQPTDINPELYLPSSIGRISLCELEGDVTAEHILNRLEIKQGELGSNPGIVALWEDEKQRRRNKNVDSQISQCLSQTKRDCSVTASHILLKQALQEKFGALSVEPETSSVMDLSVYPAETPDSDDILNASSLLSQSSAEAGDVTLRNDTTFNESDHVDPLDLLCEVLEKEAAEEGSLLSQVVRNPEESEGEEAEADLSLPLSPITIPQLDGNADFEFKTKQKKQGLDMPVLKNIDYTRECFVVDGKWFKLTLKKPSLMQPEIPKSPPAVRKSRVKKHQRRLDLVKLINEIKSECIFKRIQRTKTAKFRTVPPLARLQSYPSKDVYTAKIVFPTVAVSHEVIVAFDSKQFSCEEITSSKFFPLLQEEFNRITADNKKIKERKRKELVTAAFMSHSYKGCKRRSCTVLKRYLFQLTDGNAEITLDEIKAKLQDFSCSVSNLFDIKCEVKKKVVRRAVVRNTSGPSTIGDRSFFATNPKTVSRNTGLDLDENCNIKNTVSIKPQITGRTADDYKHMYLAKRRYMKIYKKVALRQLRALDGANDSSSSEDESDNRKSSQRKRGTFYSPLFVDESSAEKPDFG